MTNYPSVRQFRKKPVVINAAKFTGDNLEELIEWAGGNLDSDARVTTLEGVMQLNLGAYLAQGVKGEFYPIDAEIMQLTYDVVA